MAKKSQGPRDLGKYKSSEWLLKKMAISLGFWLKKNIECFLLRFSNATFHIEIGSANMTLPHQSMVIHVKYSKYRRKCNKQELWEKKQLNLV